MSRQTLQMPPYKQTVTPLDRRQIKLMHKHACSCEIIASYLSFHSGRKCKQCAKGMRNKVNIAPVLAIIPPLGDKRPAKCLACPVGAVLQRWPAAKPVLTWTQQPLTSLVDPLRSESDRVGLSFIPSVYKETPVQYGKPQKDGSPPCQSLLS